MNHELKILEKFHNLLWTWEKTFEIRKNDRNFQEWDTVTFKIIEEDSWLLHNSILKLQITNLFQDKWFWLEDWYCILSFKEI